eukprot:c5574_g1_i1 orf=33-206(+)
MLRTIATVTNLSWISSRTDRLFHKVHLRLKEIAEKLIVKFMEREDKDTHQLGEFLSR